MKARRGLSLRARLLLGFAAVAMIAIAVAAIVTITTRHYQVAQLDGRLLSFAGPSRLQEPLAPPPADSDPTNPTDSSSLSNPVYPSDPTDPTDPGQIVRPSDALRGFFAIDGTLRVYFEPNVAGAPTTTPLLGLDDMPPSGVAFLTVPSSDGTDEFRVLARASGGGWDITAFSLRDVEAATRRLVTIETIGILAMLAGLALVAIWVIRLGITPMRRMVNASALIAKGDLDVRLEGAGRGSESAELADSLNAMIGNLTDAIDEREKSEARLRDFVADASHELRTPLTTVLGYAELYRKGGLKGKAAVTEAWGRTEAEAARMRRLVEGMLELARFDNAPMLRRDKVDMVRIATEVVSDARASFPDRTLTLDAPPTAPMVGDPDRLRQALVNVVVNAAIHGGQAIEVAVTAKAPGVAIVVSDDGPGMAPEVAARATERFVRADSSRSRARGGAGLGLAITAAIIEAHGGTLAVKSRTGHGTTVSMAFPPLGSD
jgi:two-component system OmpR family sensor kinase